MPNNTILPLDKFYPCIKSPDWLESGNNLYSESLYTGKDTPEAAPVIAYGVDQDGSVGFLLKDTLPSSQMVDMRFVAQRNLDARLAPLEWKVGACGKQLELEGDYYASEGLLSHQIMNRAHDALKSARLAAAAPRRGELMVLAIDDVEQSEIERFVDTVLKRYFVARHSGETEVISPMIWMVVQGEIKGFMKLDSDYEKYWDKQIGQAVGALGNSHAETRYNPSPEETTLDAEIHQTIAYKAKETRLFTYGQLLAGGAIGTVMAGLLMLGWNFRKLNEHGKFKVTFLAAAPVTAVVLYLASVIPRTSFDRLWPVVSALAVYGLSIIAQGDVLSGISNISGKKRQPFWMMVVFIALGLVGTLAVLTILILLKLVG